MEPTVTWLNAIFAEPAGHDQRPTREPMPAQASKRRPVNDVRRVVGHGLVALGMALAGDNRGATITPR